MATKKKSMVLNLQTQEMQLLELLAERRGTTKTGLLRQALKLFESIDERMERGERLYLENPENKEKMELMLL